MKKIKSIKILFLDILTGDQNLRKTLEREEGGSYAAQMRRACGLTAEQLVWVDASLGEFPDAGNFDAVIIGGSVEDPVRGREKPWMRKVYAYIRLLIRKKIPILGICGGLQFTVRALREGVVYNPKGREFGTVRIRLTDAGKKDPIFRGLRPNFMIQSSHKCMAKNLPPGSKLLAASRLCKTQAIALGERTRLVQFHPEMREKEVKAIARLRKNTLIKEGFVRDEADFKKFLGSIKSAENTGRKILQNFINYFALPNP